jgi:hypothetical protein
MLPPGSAAGVFTDVRHRDAHCLVIDLVYVDRIADAAQHGHR